MNVNCRAGQGRRPMSSLALGVACWILFWDGATAAFAPLSNSPPSPYAPPGGRPPYAPPLGQPPYAPPLGQPPPLPYAPPVGRPPVPSLPPVQPPPPPPSPPPPSPPVVLPPPPRPPMVLPPPPSPPVVLPPPPSPGLEWGAATSAYQVEGAINEGGRGKSIYEPWLKRPFTTQDNSNADVTADFYHKYPDDIAIMKSLGTPNFRMSISWPRIYPKGSGAVNLEGLAFYDKVIDGLLAANVKPYVTLYHWDLPQALQKAYGGFLNTTQFSVDFANYASTVVEHFGDRVQSYVTFNEPSSVCAFGYGVGVAAPGVIGNFYRCVYTLLSAHAAAAKRIRIINPTAKIGMAMFQDYPQPYTNSPQDIEAAERYFDFQVGVYADPVFKGDYPASVKKRVPSNMLPRISPQLKSDLLGSTDFYGMNHYTAIWVWNQPFGIGLYSQGITDYGSGFTAPNGSVIGSPTGSSWAFWTPWAFRKMLNYVNNRYHPKEIHVTEQGTVVTDEYKLPIPQAQNDLQRIAFFQSYLQGANEAIRQDGIPLTKYFVWAFMDNWEWYGGYNPRFGIVYTDYKNNQTRYVKDSAKWLAYYFGTLPNRNVTAPNYRQDDRAGWRNPYAGA